MFGSQVARSLAYKAFSGEDGFRGRGFVFLLVSVRGSEILLEYDAFEHAASHDCWSGSVCENVTLSAKVLPEN